VINIQSESEKINIWIVIAAFNEGPVIYDVVKSVRSHGYSIVVVDDGSDDDTRRRASEAGAWTVRHAINLGQGAAIQTGMTFALEKKAGAIVTFDSDGQHNPDEIDGMLRTLIDNKADIVFGSRFLGGVVNMPMLKRLILKAGIVFSNATSGLCLTDTHNGFRAISRDAAFRIRLRRNRMAHASEFIKLTGELRLNWIEHPVHIAYTDYSKAKGQKLVGVFEILKDMLIARLGK
jgi:glycosyltransferase involved in cell wall biosynthesis